MNTSKQFSRDALGWGLFLWGIGYILSIILFVAVPPSLIGWIITPIATVITLWVLMKRIKNISLYHYFIVGVIWTFIAIILDYLLIVKAFKPEDGYYKFDVYLYYGLTFSLPIIVGIIKQRVSHAGTAG